MILGMIELGRMIMVQQVITNASREGARIAMLDGATTQEVQSAVMDYLESAQISGVGPEHIPVDPDPPDLAGYGAPVTVTVSVPFNQVSWLPTSFFGNDSKVLSAVTVMRRETVQ